MGIVCCCACPPWLVKFTSTVRHKLGEVSVGRNVQNKTLNTEQKSKKVGPIRMSSDEWYISQSRS